MIRTSRATAATPSRAAEASHCRPPSPCLTPSAAPTDSLAVSPCDTRPSLPDWRTFVPPSAHRRQGDAARLQATSLLTGVLMMGGAIFSTLAGTLPAIVHAAPPPVAEMASNRLPTPEKPSLAPQTAASPVHAPKTLLAVEPEVIAAAAPEAPRAHVEVPLPSRRPHFDATPTPHQAQPETARTATNPRPPAETKSTLKLPPVPTPPLEKLAESLGVSGRLLETASPTAISSLERLPVSVRTMYKNLDDRFKRLMVQKLEGKTSVLFTEISHRQAFIDGQAMGVDAFDKMHELVHENVDSGKIDAGTARKLDQAIEAFRHMTREQRAAVVGLLERDVGRR